MTTKILRVTTTLLIAASLVLTAAAGPTLAAKADKKKKAKNEPAPSAVIAVLKGDKFRMASSKMADRVVRIEDAAGDQVTSAGQPAIGAPPHSDLAAVHVAATDVPAKLLSKMSKDFPTGTAGSFYGNDAAWDRGDAAIFVAATLADKRPADAPGQQLEVRLDGDGASPLQVASAGDPLAGVERFSLSGIFNNGSWTSGTTDVSGRLPGGDIEWYNASSGNFGYYDAKRATYYMILPRPRDVSSVSVALRTSTEAGEVIDDLLLPDGGAFIDLDDPSGGFSAGAGLEPLSCRALETFSSDSTDPAPADPDGTLIRYTVGLSTADTEAAARVLAPALDALGTVPLLVTEFGADEEAEALQVEGELAAAGSNAVTLTLEVPAGRWSFSPAEEAQLELPNGEALIDHTSLTGSAGVLTGPGLDGVVAGDPACTPPEPTSEASAEASPSVDSSPAAEGSPAADAEATEPEG
jgi:hypothetical protein